MAVARRPPSECSTSELLTTIVPSSKQAIKPPWSSSRPHRYAVRVPDDVPSSRRAAAADGPGTDDPQLVRLTRNSTRMSLLFRIFGIRRPSVIDGAGDTAQDDPVNSNEFFILQHRKMLTEVFNEVSRSAIGRDHFAIAALIEASLYDVGYWASLKRAGFHKLEFEQTGEGSAIPSLRGTCVGGPNDGGHKILMGHPASIEDSARDESVSTGEAMWRILRPNDPLPWTD
jgi:hypothetical protein